MGKLPNPAQPDHHSASFPRIFKMTTHPEKLNIVVTGGCGYLGSVLVPLLLENGHFVTVFDNLSYGQNGIQDVINHGNFKLVPGDICDETAVSTLLTNNVHAIIHLAAIVGYPACEKNPELATNVHEKGTANITKQMKPHQRLIYASTGSSYGAVDGVCTEDTPVVPLTLYGRTKANAEKTVVDNGGVALRLATLFGYSPRLRLDLLVNDLTYRAVKHKKLEIYEGHFRRTFLHVKDAAKAFVLALNRYEEMKGKVYNVGDEKLNLTKIEVCSLLQRLIPGTVVEEMEGQDKDKRDYEVSYARIRKLGFCAEVSLENGVSELIGYVSEISLEEVQQARNV